MSITVNINTIDRKDHIDWRSLNVQQNLTSQVDKCTFKIKKADTGKTYKPNVGDDIQVLDGATTIFGGEIVRVNEVNLSVPDGVVYDVECADYEFGLQNILFAESYETTSIEDIIADIFDKYVAGYTYANVSASFVIQKIVFNNITVIQALKRLAEVVKYEYYVDPDKDLHFFQKFTNSAPFNLTDSDAYSIKGSLDIRFDGSQIANAVKVRGGEYDGSVFEEILTAGAGQLSFPTKNKMSDLAVELNDGGGYVVQTVGVEFLNTFAEGFTVLQNYQDQSFRFENGLVAGDLVKYSGLPKIRVLVESEDPTSIAEFGKREKIIQDTSIEDNATARQRARAEVSAYKDEMVEAKFKTYTPGLRSGQLIKITNTKFDLDTDFLIKKVIFKTFTEDSYVYQASLTTARKYELVELLMRLIEPDAVQADDNEVAEKLKTDIKTITIGESIARQTAESDDATIEITENIQDDPLGAGVEPTWVLADYFPTSITDTKRVGLLDRSMEVY